MRAHAAGATLRNTPRPALKAKGACAKRRAGRAGGTPDADKFGECSIDACIAGSTNAVRAIEERRHPGRQVARVGEGWVRHVRAVA